MNFYRSTKFIKFPICVGIVPESGLSLKVLTFTLNSFEKRIIEELNFYRYCKFVRLPSSVGIVPESWFSLRCLKKRKKVEFPEFD